MDEHRVFLLLQALDLWGDPEAVLPVSQTHETSSLDSPSVPGHWQGNSMAASGKDLTSIRAQLAGLRSYDDFKALYLSLEPTLTDSPAFVAALIEAQLFDWLDQLVEETLEEPQEAYPDTAAAAA